MTNNKIYQKVKYKNIKLIFKETFKYRTIIIVLVLFLKSEKEYNYVKFKEFLQSNKSELFKAAITQKANLYVIFMLAV